MHPNWNTWNDRHEKGQNFKNWQKCCWANLRDKLILVKCGEVKTWANWEYLLEYFVEMKASEQKISYFRWCSCIVAGQQGRDRSNRGAQAPKIYPFQFCLFGFFFVLRLLFCLFVFYWEFSLCFRCCFVFWEHGRNRLDSPEHRNISFSPTICILNFYPRIYFSFSMICVLDFSFPPPSREHVLRIKQATHVCPNVPNVNVQNHQCFK